jgi:hypothetical protein
MDCPNVFADVLFAEADEASITVGTVPGNHLNRLGVSKSEYYIESNRISVNASATDVAVPGTP